METRRIAIFDFDKTMVSGDSITDFVRFLWDRKLISLPQLVRILLVSLLWILHLQPVEKPGASPFPAEKAGRRRAHPLFAGNLGKETWFPRIFRHRWTKCAPTTWPDVVLLDVPPPPPAICPRSSIICRWM